MSFSTSADITSLDTIEVVRMFLIVYCIVVALIKLDVYDWRHRAFSDEED